MITSYDIAVAATANAVGLGVGILLGGARAFPRALIATFFVVAFVGACAWAAFYLGGPR
jgi:hypothetical protein